MSQRGNIQFVLIFSVPPEHVEEGNRIFDSHAKWLERTHHKEGEKALLRYNFSAAPESENPMDPNAEPTGRTNFVLAEVYKSEAGLQDHWQQAEKWEDWDALQSWLEEVEFTMVNGAQIRHSLW